MKKNHRSLVWNQVSNAKLKVLIILTVIFVPFLHMLWYNPSKSLIFKLIF